MKELGLYVHIPFCVKKCNYCDFCSYDNLSDGIADKYTDALAKEIKNTKALCDDYVVDSIFFGGGTPSLLTKKQLDIIFSALNEYNISSGAEISAEINPGTVNADYLRFLREIGINRLSIGMQSALDAELKLLGRIHTSRELAYCFSDARRAGFDNVNIDIMTALPGQSIVELDKTIDYAISTGCEHISAYMLKIEEGTPFEKIKDKLNLPNDDESADIYLHTCERLEGAGYNHYEISNFAKPGYDCRHNLKYWRGKEYIGFGVSAHSFFNGERFGKGRDIFSYIKGEDITGKHEKIDGTCAYEEYLMLSLRLDSGISYKDFYERFKESFPDKYRDFIDKTVRCGYAREERDRYFLTDKGMCISNQIICEFM
ncbi:MAG: radical SAM family heme chaperone HemW [Eubacteriales bacterium]|nr:radical SAM family heme chaperone HemW [Eubacteriales bacterium]